MAVGVLVMKFSGFVPWRVASGKSQLAGFIPVDLSVSQTADLDACHAHGN
jgi:hypothetical protein